MRFAFQGRQKVGKKLAHPITQSEHADAMVRDICASRVNKYFHENRSEYIDIEVNSAKEFVDFIPFT